MPARTRRSGGATTNNAGKDPAVDPSSSPPPPEEEVQLPSARAGAPAPAASSGLKFNQPLSWRAGRPIPVAELLKRLQALANEMRDMDQEDDESIPLSLGGVAKELADQQLLGHKDKGVKAWVACCAVDVLRLCAPNAPFTSKQLRVSHGSRPFCCIYRSSTESACSEVKVLIPKAATDICVGYLRNDRPVHSPGSIRSIPTIQYAAHVRPSKSRIGEEHCACYGRSP